MWAHLCHALCEEVRWHLVVLCFSLLCIPGLKLRSSGLVMHLHTLSHLISPKINLNFYVLFWYYLLYLKIIYHHKYTVTKVTYLNCFLFWVDGSVGVVFGIEAFKPDFGSQHPHTSQAACFCIPVKTRVLETSDF